MRVFLVLFVWLSASRAFADDKTFGIPYGSLPQPTVDVFIDGAGPYKFLIDTGSTYSVIKESVFDKAGLTYADSRVASFYPPTVSFLGDLSSKPSDLTRLSIAGTDIGFETRLLAFPGEAIEGGAVGVLGLYELRGATLSNDVSRQTLTLSYRRPLGLCDRSDAASACHDIRPLAPIRQVARGDVRALALIDTGYLSSAAPIMTRSRFSQMTWDYLEAVGEPTWVFEGFPEPDVKVFRVGGLSLFGDKACEVEFILPKPYDEDGAPDPAEETYDPYIVVGWQRLKTIPFTVSVPLDGSATRFDVGEDCVAPTPNSFGFLEVEVFIPDTEGVADWDLEQIRSGVLRGQARPATLRVTDLVPGSPVWVAGLRRGDRVTAFTGPDGRRMTLRDSDFVPFLRTLGQSEGDSVAIEYVDAAGKETVARIVTRKSRRLGAD